MSEEQSTSQTAQTASNETSGQGSASNSPRPQPSSDDSNLTPTGIFDMVKGLLGREFNPKSRHRQHERIGQTLVNMGAIEDWQLQEAVNEQRRTGQLLGKILLDRSFVDAETVSIALSKLSGMEYASLEKTPSEPEALNAISENVAAKYKILPVRLENDKLTVLIEAPQDRNSLDDVSVLLGMRLKPILTTTEDIRREIKSRYRNTKMKKRRPQSVIMTPEDRAKLAATMETLQSADKEAVQKVMEEVSKETEEDESDVDVEVEVVEKPTPVAPASRFKHTQVAGMPVVKLVATIIEDALDAGATDIHFDPQDPEMRVRYRVDGVLHDIMTIPENIEAAIVSRIKIMADMDITETRRPQDGHISLEIGERECDIRIASLPTFLGERVVLRLLDQSAVLSGIEGLGLNEKEEELLRKVIAEPYGMILVTGPTGSGKTTTLYSALNQKDVTTESIVTLEDPVEYQLAGINQVQIDPDIDLTFANTLRASLRQDIDVLLIGEIRDVETAHIAVRAAMTGHLVFSTLHTNDAPEAITTLRNMGIPSYLMGSALTAIIGQRLVKRICPNCKTRFRTSKALLKSLGLPETRKTLYRGKGCESCYNSGCHGRTGIFEILAMTPELRKMITDEESTEAIVKAANLRTMADSCRDKMIEGVIAPEEFLRVIRY